MTDVEIVIRQDQVELLLSALKVAESRFTDEGKFEGAKLAGKLHAELRKQIYTYGQVA